MKLFHLEYYQVPLHQYLQQTESMLSPDVPPAMTDDATNIDHDNFNLPEICTYQLISLLEEAKAPRNCYDRLIALLKKQQKMGFSVGDFMGRDISSNH